MEHHLQLFLTDFVLMIPTIGVLILGLIPHQWFAIITRSLFLLYYGGTVLLRMSTLYVNVETREFIQGVYARIALIAHPFLTSGNISVATPSMILVLSHVFFERARMHPYVWLSVYIVELVRIGPVWYITLAIGIEACCLCFKPSYSVHGSAIALANTLTALNITYINSKPLPQFG